MTWDKCLGKDLAMLGLKKEWAIDHYKWKTFISGNRPTPAGMENGCKTIKKKKKIRTEHYRLHKIGLSGTIGTYKWWNSPMFFGDGNLKYLHLVGGVTTAVRSY